MPHRFNSVGELLPIPLTPLQDARNRIAELEQDLQTTADALGHANHDIMVRETAKDETIATLRAENEALSEDAARYRWLRNHKKYAMPTGDRLDYAVDVFRFTTPDAAIDAERLN